MSLKPYKDLNINVFSKTITDYLGKSVLLPGMVAKYRLLNGTPQFNKKSGKTDMIYPASQSIRLKSNVIDPGYLSKKDESDKEGTLVDAGIKTCGIVLEIDKNGNPKFHGKLYVYPAMNQPEFYIKGDTADDVLIYEALELSCENKSNPFRDQAVTPVFERINEVAEAKQRSNKRNYLKDSLNAIGRWDYEQMKAIGAGYNISTKLPMETIKDQLESIAEKDPETFYKNIDKESTKLKGLISVAKEAGVIHFSAMENTWYFTGTNEVITMLPRKEGVSEVDQFALFLDASANGPRIQGNIEKLVRAKK